MNRGRSRKRVYELDMSNFRGEVTKAKSGKRWGIILGSLGRQGSPNILRVQPTFLGECP